ncbi:hypothetical protein HIM_07696 [Hirsutella minnesotensis 3608]|uniref:PHD finger domain protein n=1 Tax=Hirsutella minnesotensis 3608 TaxID=1043627 RepID=A0A0F7ZTD7_9HYPO|nr:hypothetical protein HIM_07696 [Hirsutella minnesotensis 3608]
MFLTDLGQLARHPVFETPRPFQGSFSESGGQSPRFAEEYSVFNSTPGNLRGSQGSFADFIGAAPAGLLGSHKRLLSIDGPFRHTALHVNSVAKSDKAAPCDDSSRQHPPSPKSPTSQTVPNSHSDSRPAKKVCRDVNEKRQEPSQLLPSPPPSTHKTGRKLHPHPNMHHDHSFGHADLTDATTHDMAVLMGHSGDLFGYPMSAPAAAPTNFWDPAVSMDMDLDFNVAGHHAMHALTPSSHRHTGSFDWNADIQLFQDVAVPAPSANQENIQPVRRERTLAPKPASSEEMANNTSDSAPPATQISELDDPFGIINPGEVVDPGLLFGRPLTSALDSSFNAGPCVGSADAQSNLSAKRHSSEVRRTDSAKVGKSAKVPDRALNSSPIKSSARPGLGRSCSENRGKRAMSRRALPMLAEAGGPVLPPSHGRGAPSSRSGSRPSVRQSPSKTMPRLSTLASIPEMSPQNRPRASVRFTIDSRGRARAETTLIGETASPDRSLHRSRSCRVVGSSRSWDSSDDDSTDDEPIIIPSHPNSFNASFALPDPRKPVGSIFHKSSDRDSSDRSRSASANGADSEAETVVSDRQHKKGDATSELRRVVEDRQKWSSRMGSARSKQFISTNVGNYPGGIISPTSLTDSSHGLGGHGVRCVCNSTSADEADGFMLQW